MKAVCRPLMFSLTLSLLFFVSCEKEERMSPIEQIENGLSPNYPAPDQSNWNIAERMAHYGIHGVSFAVIDNNELVLAKAYGVSEASGAPVTEKSLFQMSCGARLTTELAALRMVGEGKLTLDGPINDVMTSWQLPENELTQAVPVSLRLLLSHAAGINQSSFLGYQGDDTLPTLGQVLEGQAPANTPALRVVRKPGTLTRSINSGGFAIVQQALSDISGLPFDQLLKESVLDPLGMTESTFEQPLSAARLGQAVTGHYLSGRPVEGKGRIFVEAAAAGLWSTPSDFAKALIEFFLATQDKKSVFLSPEVEKDVLQDLAKQTNTERVVRLREIDPTDEDDGFFTFTNYAPFEGNGVIIATNGSDSRLFAAELVRAIARTYQWPAFLRKEIQTQPMTNEALDLFTGRYAAGPINTMMVTRGDGFLLAKPVLSQFADRLVPISPDTFVNQSNRLQVTFRRERDGRASAYTFQGQNQQEIILPRRPDDQYGVRELVIDGKMDEALAAYRALEKPPSEPMLVTVAYGLHNRGRSDDAITILDLAAEFYPEVANIHDSRGEIFVAMGDRQRAIEAFRTAQFKFLLDKSLAPTFRTRLEARARYHLARLEP